MPKIMPKNMYKRICPLLNLNIEYNITVPENNQNKKSSKYVIKSGVLKLFLNILNMSNNIPIIKPFNTNIINT